MKEVAKRTTVKDGIIHTYRKAIKQNGTTLTISLPIQWVREHNIKPGDEFAMTANSMVSLVRIDRRK